MTHHGLPQAIRAEASQADITVATMAQRMRVSYDVAADVVADLLVADLLEVKHRNNERFYCVTDKGYQVAAIQRPVWMMA